jgi:hypothetical protein
MLQTRSPGWNSVSDIPDLELTVLMDMSMGVLYGRLLEIFKSILIGFLVGGFSGL